MKIPIFLSVLLPIEATGKRDAWNDIIYPRHMADAMKELYNIDTSDLLISESEFPSRQRSFLAFAEKWHYVDDDGLITIPYGFSAGIKREGFDRVNDSKKYWEKNWPHRIEAALKEMSRQITCMKFERVDNPLDYKPTEDNPVDDKTLKKYKNGLLFISGDTETVGSGKENQCWSTLGLDPGHTGPGWYTLPMDEYGAPDGWQVVALGRPCSGYSKSVIQHEVGHALGRFHEFDRPDRKKYVKEPYAFHPARAHYEMWVPEFLNEQPMEIGSSMMYPSAMLSNMKTLNDRTWGYAPGITTMDILKIEQRYCEVKPERSNDYMYCSKLDKANVKLPIFLDRICDNHIDCPDGLDETGDLGACKPGKTTPGGCCDEFFLDHDQISFVCHYDGGSYHGYSKESWSCVKRPHYAREKDEGLETSYVRYLTSKGIWVFMGNGKALSVAQGPGRSGNCPPPTGKGEKWYQFHMSCANEGPVEDLAKLHADLHANHVSAYESANAEHLEGVNYEQVEMYADTNVTWDAELEKTWSVEHLSRGLSMDGEFQDVIDEWNERLKTSASADSVESMQLYGIHFAEKKLPNGETITVAQFSMDFKMIEKEKNVAAAGLAIQTLGTMIDVAREKLSFLGPDAQIEISKVCPSHASFETCGSACDPVCEKTMEEELGDNLFDFGFGRRKRREEICGEVCIPRCVCNNGYIWKDDECIREVDCPTLDKKEIPCPPCWKYNPTTNVCDMLTRDQGEECYDLTCNFDKMIFGFSSLLLDIEDNHEFEDGEAVFDEERGRWKMECPLGKCDMSVETRELDDGEEYLVFGKSISVKSAPKMVEGDKIFIKSPMSVKVTVECAYRSEVKINTDDFVVHSVQANGEAINFGELNEGFKVNLYQDVDFTEPVGDEKLYVGSTIYASVDWTVESLTEKVNFFVDKCEVGLPDSGTIAIIDKNCYSTTFDAKQLQSEKMVPEKSRFQFVSFIVGNGGRSMQMKLSCTVQMCTTEDGKCEGLVTVKDDECVQNTELGYKANTFNA